MTIPYPSFKPKNYVPEDAAKKFIELYDSLCLGLENVIKAQDIRLASNPSLNKTEIRKLYTQQIKAIKGLLTKEDFRKFWEDCDKTKAEIFYNAWQDTFNGLVGKPRISKSEKRRKLLSAKSHIDRIIDLTKIDASLQRELCIAITNAVNTKWPKTRTETSGSEDWETIKSIEWLENRDAEAFLNILSHELGKIAKPDAWQSTHNLYPRQILEPSEKGQYFVRSLGPSLYAVFGSDKHTAVANMLNALFDLVPKLTSGTVRDTKRQNMIVG